MSATPTIDSLIEEGALVLWHDYSGGFARDLSGNSNDGTITNAWLTAAGMKFPSAGKVTVADSAELQLTEGAIIVTGSFTCGCANERLVYKRDAGGTNYDLYLVDTPRIRLYDGTSDRWVAGSMIGKTTLGVNFGDAATAEGFIDGSSIGNFNGASSVSVDDAPVTIGNYDTTTVPFRSTMYSVMIINRNLTVTEMATIHTELGRMKWAKKSRTRTGLASSGDVYFMSGWPAREIANVAPGSLIPGTDWAVQSGAFAVSHETVNGATCKVVECTNDGIISIPETAMLGSPTDNAYGTWEMWLYKANASALSVSIVGQAAGAITAGDYVLEADASEAVILDEQGTGAVISGGTMDHSTWTKFKITRDTAAGEFKLYIRDNTSKKDVLIGTGTDNTLTTSSFIVLDMDNGDKLCLGDPSGENAFSLRRGVV